MSSFRFKRRESLSRGFVRIARSELEGALAGLGANTGSPAASEGVHEARRRIKKLRALLRLMRPALSEETFARDDSAIREAAHGLSPVRDAAMRLATLESLLDVHAEREAEKLAPLRQHFAAARDRFSSAQSQAPELDAVLGRLRALIEKLTAELPATDEKALLDDALRRAYRRARRAFNAAKPEPSDELLHTWRKRVKTLQHQLLLVRAAAPKLCRRMLRRLEHLGECLGLDHDLATLVAALPPEPTTDARALAGLSRRIEKRRQSLQRKALQIGRKCFADKPSAWLKPLTRAWRRWHKPR